MKIHICGIYGCGKTTLAKYLSKKLNIPNYSLDDFKYKVKYNEIYPVEERVKKVNQITSKDKWITEGTWSGYAKNSFKNADIIILMLTPKYKCCYRILKRFFKRQKGKKDNLIVALKLCGEVFKYHNEDRPVSLKSHKELILKYNKKPIIVRKNDEIKKLIIKKIEESENK